MSGPLTGYRVIEIAGIGPGPFCAMLLADMGADVIRVDRAQSVRGPAPDEPPSDVSLRGRRSVAIDLKHPDGVATLLDLVEQADALIEGFRPGVMERLGIGPDECLARNPKLVYGRMTGWGQDGPYAPCGRPRHQLHLARRRARPHRPGRRGPGAAAQPRRRLRRRRHVPRLRRRVRAPRGPAERRRARSSTRRWSTAPPTLMTMFWAMSQIGRLGRRAARHQPARHRRPLLRRLRVRRRRVRLARLDRAAVLRRAAAPHRARPTTRSSPSRWTSRSGRR